MTIDVIKQGFNATSYTVRAVDEGFEEDGKAPEAVRLRPGYGATAVLSQRGQLIRVSNAYAHVNPSTDGSREQHAQDALQVGGHRP